MNINYVRIILIISITLGFLSSEKSAYSAVDQILNDLFFQNPAELSKINQTQWIGGNTYVAPKFKFTGTSGGNAGTAVSEVSNSLPYVLSAYRLTPRLVVGINLTPSAYGNLDWPIDSIVATATTKTEVLYYRAGFQSSYQITDNLSLGAGFNIERNKQLEIDFVIQNIGNQINRVDAWNYGGDIGLYYKINANNSLTMAVYSPITGMGHGRSSLNTTTVTNFSLNITEASVAYIGLQHQLNNKWTIGETVYWSGWSLEKSVNFYNRTNGDLFVPTNWRDVWSFQVVNRYATTERVALLGAMIYETNPNPSITNKIAYPLGATLFISGGLDLSLLKGLSAQFIYGYKTFTSKSLINNPDSHGLINFNAQAAVVQFVYKV